MRLGGSGGPLGRGDAPSGHPALRGFELPLLRQARAARGFGGGSRPRGRSPTASCLRLARRSAPFRHPGEMGSAAPHGLDPPPNPSPRHPRSAAEPPPRVTPRRHVAVRRAPCAVLFAMSGYCAGPCGRPGVARGLRQPADRGLRGEGVQGGVEAKGRREGLAARMAKRPERRATGGQDARRERPLGREVPLNARAAPAWRTTGSSKPREVRATPMTFRRCV